MKAFTNPQAIRVIYLLASLKMVFWAIGIIFFKTYSVNTAIVPIIEAHAAPQWAMLFMGLVGTVNYFLKVSWLNILTALQMSILWIYGLLLFGVHHTSFFRTLPETIFILVMTAFMIYKKGKIE